MSNFQTIDLKGVKGVLLDLDNTVYMYDVCHQHALKGVFENLKSVIQSDDFEQFVETYNKAKLEVKKKIPEQAASHSRLLYFQYVFEEVFGMTKPVLSLRSETVYWDTFFERMELIDGVMDFLNTCKQRDVRVCVVTDLTAQIQLKKIVHLGIDEHIDFVVTSEEAGIEKPVSGIFLHALDKLGLKEGEAIVVGDNEVRDIAGAKRLGMKYIHIRHNM